MPRDPFDVRLSEEKEREFVDDLVNEIHDAMSARQNWNDEITYARQLYEQQRTRIGSSAPWPDAADLTSPLGTEKVDAITARVSQAIFTEPIWAVEGWGEAQNRAAEVEEFHQWKAEEERVQSTVEKAWLLSFIEGIGVLEVYENTERRTVKVTKNVQIQRDPLTGAPLLDQDGKGIPAKDENGRLVPAEPGDDFGSLEVTVDEDQRIRTGPAYKVIPVRDFYMLPGHAKDRDEVYAYAKRFWLRKAQLDTRASMGIYKKKVVDEMTSHGERTGEEKPIDDGISIVDQDKDRAEKELWEVLVRKSFKPGKPERWYLATIHLRDRKLLRLQHDDLNRKRFVIFTPLPKPDSVYGYSMIAHKLGTTIEEHTAWRNMLADKAAMSLMGPIKRLVSAHWHPEEQPLGPKAVIDVRDLREMEPMQLPDLPRGAREREQEVKEMAERLAGINDIALGVNPSADRTLGEVQLVASQSAVRMELITRHLQEGMEDLFQIRHQIWLRALSEMDAIGDPQQLPSSVLTGLENRGLHAPENGIITAAMLDGAFRGKPHGSVETADPAIMRQDFVQMIQMLPALMQANPMIGQAFGTPEAARALVNEFARVFRIENRAPFMAALNQAQQQALLPAGPEAGNVLPFEPNGTTGPGTLQ